jgi:hypothetical protein
MDSQDRSHPVTADTPTNTAAVVEAGRLIAADAATSPASGAVASSTGGSRTTGAALAGRATWTMSGKATAWLGFWSAAVAASCSVVFSIASVPVLAGLVAPPWDNVLTLVPSLLLAPALLVVLICVDDAAPPDKKIWSHVAVAFAGVYVALVSVVYVVELAVVEPLIVSGQVDRAGLLTIDPGGVLNAIDGLGYVFLCLALLFAAPVFTGPRLDRWTRWLLVLNGVTVGPIVLTYFVDRAFLVLAGPTWAVAVPAVCVLMAVSFHRARHAPQPEASSRSAGAS